MSDVEACKRELASIVDGGSIDPRGETMTEPLMLRGRLMLRG
jgi:hypothetical protein